MKTLVEMISTQGMFCVLRMGRTALQITTKRVKELIRDWTSNTAKKGAKSDTICQ